MRNLTILVAALAASATPALAQNADAGSTAQNEVNVVAITGAQGSSKITNDGHVWSTPTVLGSSFGGANPCLVGSGAGAAGGPVGFSINIGRSDEACTRRNDAAAFHAMGMDNVAIARMCQDRDNADAFFSATGYACPGTDRKRYKLANGEQAEYAYIPARMPK